MRILSIVLAASLAGALVSCSSQNGSTTSQEPAEKNLTEASGAPVETNAGLYGLAAQTLEGEPVNLSAYAGKVTLVVNVASKCGGGQEPGSAQDIRSFCTERFDVSFPMFAKCDVKPGDSQSPIFAFLEQQSGQVPGWNFCKYLVGPDGQVIQFYASGVAPDADELRKAIETALG